MIEPDALLAGEGHHRGALDPGRVRDAVVQSLRGDLVDGRKILVLTPDGTRTAPLPFMVRILAETVGVRAARMDFMVALGTHQPLSDPALLDLYGLTGADKQRLLPNSKLLNHRWDLADTLVRLGALSGRAIADLSEGRFKDPVDVTINGRLLDYDLILILGPVFPHEVAGFSGGTKYLFPGVSGGDFLHFTHWLGALATCWRTIGFPDTPVRRARTLPGGRRPRYPPNATWCTRTVRSTPWSGGARPCTTSCGPGARSCTSWSPWWPTGVD
jgi:nickel-dependent lactate racemase